MCYFGPRGGLRGNDRTVLESISYRVAVGNILTETLNHFINTREGHTDLCRLSQVIPPECRSKGAAEHFRHCKLAYMIQVGTILRGSSLDVCTLATLTTSVSAVFYMIHNPRAGGLDHKTVTHFQEARKSRETGCWTRQKALFLCDNEAHARTVLAGPRPCHDQKLHETAYAIIPTVWFTLPGHVTCILREITQSISGTVGQTQKPASPPSEQLALRVRL